MATTAKSPVGATSPRIGHDRGNGAQSYFPQPQQYHEGLADAETLSNTLANAHITQAQAENNSHLAAPIATRSNGRFTEEWDASQRGSSIIVDGASPVNNMHRTNSFTGSVIGDGSISLSRGNTLKKKASLRRSGSLKRRGSRRSMKAGSVRSLVLQSSSSDHDPSHSAFYCPVPTSGTPTEVLANRFQAWRKILKDLITYFREIQTHYEHRARSLLKLANVLNNTATPPGFLVSGGIDDALQILRNYNKQAILESNKAKEIEEDVILALTGLRSDLHQKIKEIKNLSGDFKNSVDKEMETTRRAVNNLQEILGQTELDSALTTGKQDPYILRLHVDRQLERQIDEENYLHQAYLNLENSGRELESIVVGEIQKSYNAYASILKRESDAAYSAVEELRVGPISMPKDTEWTSFIQRDDQFVDPDMPMRTAESIHYPGRDHHACQEIRAGLLERKSKYLKSYTAGWYVLSPTHLHEFKSADKAQAPVMSLYLPEQKLGSHSVEGGKSNKFVLKGRQTGSMHRGHTWVFRAESHDTMMAWYEDIRALTERTPEERSNFLRGHVRSISRASARSSISSDGMGDDDEEPPFTGAAMTANQQQQQQRQETLVRRPSGGRFPSDLQVNAQRGLQVPVSPISVSSRHHENGDAKLAAAVTAMPGNGIQNPYPDGESTHATGFYRDGPSPTGPRQDGYSAYPVQHTTSLGYGKAPSPMPAEIAGVRNSHGPGAPPDGTGDGPALVGPTTAIGEATVGRRGGSRMLYEDEFGSGGPLLRTSKDQRMQGMNGVVAVEQQPGLNGLQTNENPSRPGGGATRNDSVPTISNLHIPGEYPKGPSTSSR